MDLVAMRYSVHELVALRFCPIIRLNSAYGRMKNLPDRPFLKIHKCHCIDRIFHSVVRQS